MGLIFDLPFFVLIPCLLALVALIFFDESLAFLILLVGIPACLALPAAWEARVKGKSGAKKR